MDIGQAFKILGIEPKSTPDDVKQAYRDLVTVWHPDHYAHNPRLQAKVQEQLKKINLAYETVKQYMKHGAGQQQVGKEDRKRWQGETMHNKKYWVTTHYPAFVGIRVRQGVYLRNQHKKVAEPLRVGDHVIVYETKKNPPYTNEQGKVFRRVPGRGRVVCYGTVSKALHEFDEYPDSKKQWNLFAPIQVISDEGFLSRQELAFYLGFSERYDLRGLGDKHSGLKEISQEQYENIVRRFHENIRH